MYFESFIFKTLSVLFLLGFFNFVKGAGFSGHNTFARRASQFEFFGPESETFNPNYFYGLAMDRFDAVQGGAPFPDYLYACGDDHDAGEDAHWSPFQIAAANYIREHYPDWFSQTRDMDGPGLVAFFLGVTSHYIADMNWHGLETVPDGEGIIRNMGFTDFNCTNGDLCRTAHTAADTGGEFAAASSLSLSWYPARRWFIPTEDLINIYALLNVEVKSSWIHECSVIFYAGSWAVSRFGDIIYDLVMAKRVGGLLLEGYIDFPVGGVDDNAAWTSFMWNRFADWVMNGPPDNSPNRKLADGQFKRSRRLAQRKFSTGIRKVLEDNGVFPLKLRHVESFEISSDEHRELFTTKKLYHSNATFVGIRDSIKVSSGNEFIHSSKFESLIEQDRKLLRDLVDTLVNDYVLQMGNEEIEVTENIAMSVEELEFIKNQLYIRVEDILKHELFDSISGLSEQVLDYSSLNKPVVDDNISVQILGSGEAPHEYFGSSFTISDFSNSGKNCDILVGSYGAGRSGGPQEGKAKIMFNAACDLPSNNNEGNMNVKFRGAMPYNLPGYERFGWTTAACDINLDGNIDAIICAPSFGGRNVEAAVGNYSGRCDIFMGPFLSRSNADSYLTPDISIYGDLNWGLFGSVVAIKDVDSDGYEDLIISAPSAGSYPDIAPNSRGDVSSQGAVYIILAKYFRDIVSPSSDSKSFIISDIATYVLQQPASFQWFGKSIEVTDDQTLLVGAPTFHSEVVGDENSAIGRVYAFKIPSSNLRRLQSLESKTIAYSWSISGCNHAGRTGQTISFSRALKALAVSEPSFNATLTTHIKVKKISADVLRSGRVVIIPYQAILSQSLSTKDMFMCDIENWSGTNSPLILSSDELLQDGRFGSSMTFFNSGNENKIVVGSPLAHSNSGMVSLFNIELNKLGRLNGTLEWTVGGRSLHENKGRLGSSLSIVSATNGDYPVVFASAPYANAGGQAPDGDQLGVLYYIQSKNI